MWNVNVKSLLVMFSYSGIVFLGFILMILALMWTWHDHCVKVSLKMSKGQTFNLWPLLSDLASFPHHSTCQSLVTVHFTKYKVNKYHCHFLFLLYLWPLPFDLYITIYLASFTCHDSIVKARWLISAHFTRQTEIRSLMLLLLLLRLLLRAPIHLGFLICKKYIQ